ncbi:M13-type metalloendopeptidase [uncultured Brevundimonas sp.]|uniref:M13 family metallopeptidase n=1 Tax=uncultured Brevundimonas sp. TaxID=213418 RepID=UPI0030EE16DB|tara:strand:- start:41595 stop:43727 length:2133 start_codon:yes stop_codon:yes gene_type:complete
MFGDPGRPYSVRDNLIIERNDRLTMTRHSILLASAALGLILCTPAMAQPSAHAAHARAPVHAVIGTWGFDPASMDTTTRPGNDFDRYASGTWKDETTIPADRASWSVWNVLYDEAQEQLKAIIENSAANPDSSPEAQRIGNFYASYMDEARVNALGAAPMQPGLAAIRAADSHAAIARLMGESFGKAGSSLFALDVFEDLKDPDTNSAYIGQGGLGLPDRDYYLEAAFAEKKTAYQAYVAQMLTMIGWADPDKAAAAIVAFETRLAEKHWTRAQSREIDMIYNPMTMAEVATYAPGFDWAAWTNGAGLPTAAHTVVGEKTAIPELARIFGETDLATLQAYEAFHYVDQSAALLSQPFVDARFTFRSTVLNGITENRPRWNRAVRAVDGSMGEALGKEYVRLHFPASSKTEMEALVGNLRIAMTNRLQHLDWMGPATKEQALYKIGNFGVKVGYPDQWRSYDGLEIQADDLYGNVERAGAFEWAWQMGKLTRAVDPLEWGMTPQTINAYYNPPRNEIVFPAAILQAPFFDPAADPAVNYGGIGAVIGHEITHGFDDQGRKVDGDGVLRDWWTAEDAAKFEARAAVFGAQYDATEPLPGMFVNGDLTMGENIADLGGLLLALDAYHLSLNGQPAPVIDGFTGDQRLFLGWAQVWRAKQRDAALQQQLATDPHSPAAVRASVPVRNIDAWYAAFGVSPGDEQYLAPEARARIW